MSKSTTALFVAAAVALPLSASAQSGDPGQSARVRAAMERMQAEPGIIDVHRAALRYFRVNPEEVERIREKSVRRAAAPRLTISGRYEWTDSSRDILPQQINLYTYDNYTSNLAGGVVSLEWDLSGAVFNPAQLQTYALIGIQMNILKEVTRLYFVRRQLQLSLLTSPPADPQDRLAMQFRVDEFTSLLDSFTGGWFSRNLPTSD
jgi:hypothetical protein